MRRLMILLAFAGLTGCETTPTELDASSSELPLAEQPVRVGESARRVARLAMTGSDSILVELPDEVFRAQPVDVRVTTYGGGCINPDTTVSRVRGNRALIVPYQREYRPPAGGGCTKELLVERRTVRLVFAQSGPAVVRVLGRVWPEQGVVAVERRLTVR